MTDSHPIMLPRSRVVEFFRQERLRHSAQIWCFPHAGVGASEFRYWAAASDRDVLICAVQLPGRERRFNEPTVTDMAELARGLAAEIGPLLSQDAKFYGQCLGAFVAFEVIAELARNNAEVPKHLYAASQIAPQHLSLFTPDLHSVGDPELFRRSIKRLGGIPPEFENNDELWKLVEPVLRSDCLLLERYADSVSYAQIPTPVTAVVGAQDTNIEHDLVKGWERCTSSAFTFRVVSGSHFLSREKSSEVIRLLCY